MKTPKRTPQIIVSTALNQLNQRREWLYGLMLGVMCSPAVQAGILSKNLCKPYRQLVDNELFVTIGVIMAVILVIGWKLAPSGTYMQKGVGLLAALAIGLNIETIMQTAFGAGLAC